MATARVNGVNLFYELTGTGEIPLVLIHGSWDSHNDWNRVVPRLNQSFRVLTYDRRGHSQSESPAGQGSVRDDAADAAALVEHLQLAPAWAIGNSFGGSIALRFAVARPDLVRGLIIHEPPLFALLGGDPALAPVLAEVRPLLSAVADRIAAGDHAGASQQFVDTVALGPGQWERMPGEMQKVFIENAPTFLDELRDADAMNFDLSSLDGFSRPTLLTGGGQSPPTFAAVVTILGRALPHAEVLKVPGWGHVPHASHPDAFLAAVLSFIRRQRD